MGGVSSVYVRPVAAAAATAASAASANDPIADESAGNQLVEWRIQEPSTEHGAGVIEMKIVSDDREADMGRTIQFLAEENVRLRQINESLKLQIESPLIQPDLFEETQEEKIKRLEKTLANEREEKWSAIENAESCRVDLINCRKLLSNEENLRKILELKLEEGKKQLNDFERLNKSQDCLQSVVERNPDLGNDLHAFRNQMQQLREARHRAISAKSEELNRLRQELANERVLRERLERNFRPSLAGTSETCEQIESLENELKALRLENMHLNENLVQIRFEHSQLSSKCLQLQTDLSDALRKNERLARDYANLELENERIKDKCQEFDDGQANLRKDYEREKEEMLKQLMALKDIARISRQMLVIRQNQVDDLKAKINVIEETISRNQSSDGGELKDEYEKQLTNIKALKELYEERLQIMEVERSKLLHKISDDAKAMEALKDELSDLSLKYDMAAEEADQERQKNLGLDAELSACVAQAQNWQRELTCINSMLTQMLLGPSPETPEHLDRLAELLQQNHDLISQITNCEDCTDVAAALPKLLLDLITQIDDRERREVAAEIACSMTDSTDTISEQSGALPIVSYKNARIFKEPEIENKEAEFVVAPSKMSPVVQEIVTNLPKVWKVLTELLSHHSLVERQSGEATGRDRACYKRIETPNGPRSVISVSNTFIRLKELILEKKSLTQEVCRLRHLNGHLETRLEDQEKRLSSVQSELHKTWGVVGRMRAQHQQLHNHEKILRYELQEKRIMLSELRQELEHCRDKWERARRKNNESETECRKLRKEFAARKFRDLGLDASRDSGESGFSDDHCDADRSSTPSPVDFKSRTEADAIENQPSESGNYDVSVHLLPENDVLQDIPTSTPEWVDIAEDVGGGSDVVEEISMSNFTLGDELRSNMSPLEVELPPVEEEEPPSLIEESPITTEDLDPDAEQTRARAARALRLQRLEEQCALLVRKVDITTHKSNYLSNRLEELHDHYGGVGGPSTSAQENDSNSTTTLPEFASAPEITTCPPTPPPMPTDQSETITRPPTPPPLPLDQLTLDERLAARSERLRRLEEQCSSLHGQVSKTVNRGIELSAKLTEIHEGCVNSENRAAASSSTEPQVEDEKKEEVQSKPEEM